MTATPLLDWRDGSPEYPSIARLVRRVTRAPHGQKRALERSLLKARLASLKREIKTGKVGK